jgi:hypothetical protein
MIPAATLVYASGAVIDGLHSGGLASVLSEIPGRVGASNTGRALKVLILNPGVGGLGSASLRHGVMNRVGHGGLFMINRARAAVSATVTATIESLRLPKIPSG